MNKRKFNRRERRLAKSGKYNRSPKKPGIVGHGTKLSEDIVLVWVPPKTDKQRHKVKNKQYRTTTPLLSPDNFISGYENICKL